MLRRHRRVDRHRTAKTQRRILFVEPLEHRALLAALQITAQLGEHSTLDSVAQTPNYLPNVNTPGFQKFAHNDGTAFSTVTLTTGPSAVGTGGVAVDILSNGSVAKKGFANTAVQAGLADAAGTIGAGIPVTIVPTDQSEKFGDPVTIQFDFAFNVQLFAATDSSTVN